MNAVAIKRQSGRGAAEVGRGRVRRVDLTGGEATREIVSKIVLATQGSFC